MSIERNVANGAAVGIYGGLITVGVGALLENRNLIEWSIAGTVVSTLVAFAAGFSSHLRGHPD